jgi:putative phosphoesterase
MKALIVSDSHGLTNELEEITARHRHEANVFIHCGDSELSPNQKEIAHFLIVRGNCDFTAAFPNERIEEVEGIRFFITHGHLYNVKMSLLNLYYRAKETKANVVCSATPISREPKKSMIFCLSIQAASYYQEDGKKRHTRYCK